jgi:hypothetical protein
MPNACFCCSAADLEVVAAALEAVVDVDVEVELVPFVAVVVGFAVPEELVLPGAVAVPVLVTDTGRRKKRHQFNNVSKEVDIH